MHSSTKPTRHTTVIHMPASSKVRKLTIHVRPPPKITLHVTPPRKLKLTVKPPPKITLHVRPPPSNMSARRYARVDAWVCEQADIYPEMKGASIKAIMAQQLPTPPNTIEEAPASPSTASSEPSLDENFVAEDQFTPPTTVTTASSSVVSRGRSTTSKVNINAMIRHLTRPMVDGRKEAMVGALWTALRMGEIGVEEYEFMVGVLGNGKE